VEVGELVGAFYDLLWNRWDDPAVDVVLAEDFHFRGSLGAEVSGRQEWRTYRDMVRAGSSDFFNEVVEVVIEGDRAAVRLDYSGTHDGPLLGLPASGRRFSYSGAAFFEASDGQLISGWVLGDLVALKAQLLT
jgi:steroid delta-isomerase-like uncharacterized protein